MLGNSEDVVILYIHYQYLIVSRNIFSASICHLAQNSDPSKIREIRENRDILLLIVIPAEQDWDRADNKFQCAMFFSSNVVLLQIHV